MKRCQTIAPVADRTVSGVAGQFESVLRRRWVRVVASASLAAAALGIMHDSRAVPIEVDARAAQYHMSIFRTEEDGSTRIGDGFFRYDQQAVDRRLNEWLADPDGFLISIEYPVLAAEFEIFGHTFHGDEIQWIEEFDDEGNLVGIRVHMGVFGEPPYVEMAAGGESIALYFDVNGNFAECHEGFCEATDALGNYDNDLRHFEWELEPILAAEPGTLALLGLGLLGLGLTRRRAT